MQKMKALVPIFLALSGCAFHQLSHIQKLKVAYPFGLIGDDYGILSEEDLAINTCVAQAVPFALDGDTIYSYWRCYSTSDAALRCDDPDYDEDEKSMMVILALEIRSKKDGSHDYLTRRAIRLESCKYFQNEFNKLTKEESHICVSGEFWEKHSKDIVNGEMIWSFDKFKTKKGCVSYFAGQCDLKIQLKQGCRPEAMKN